MPREGVSMVSAQVKHYKQLLGPGLIGLACSGGTDSMALADAAIAEWGATNVIVIHVDHGLSPGSGRVAAEVTAWARGRGVATVVRNVVLEKRASIEAAARDARYEALEVVAREVGCRWIWLAHTANDQAETVLMRVVRGTGIAGLTGIPHIRGMFVRPLLTVPRAVTEAYVAAHGLPTWQDPMNEDASITRVRFRKRHLPALREENPALDDALIRLATIAREWQLAIEELAHPHSRFPIDMMKLLQLPDAVRKHAYAEALKRVGLGYDAVHLDQIDAMIVHGNGEQRLLDVPGGRVVLTYGILDRAHDAPASTQLVAPAGYELRTWQEGDRMKPARLKGRSRKLSDLFIDAKVPRDARRFARVVIRPADGVIVWAEHIGIAHGESDAVVPLPSRTGEAFGRIYPLQAHTKAPC
jgi:tRNA(Ile)-lysidine synthase